MTEDELEKELAPTYIPYVLGLIIWTIIGIKKVIRTLFGLNILRSYRNIEQNRDRDELMKDVLRKEINSTYVTHMIILTAMLKAGIKKIIGRK